MDVPIALLAVAAGACLAAWGVWLATTARRRALRDVQREQGDWQKRAVDAEAAATALRSREALWKDGEGKLARLYADASEDLSTPLSVLIASLEDAISADHLDEAARRDAERTRVIANALQRRVDELLLRARADSAELAPRLAREDVAALVRNACSPFEGLAHRRGLRFHVDTPDAVWGALDRDMIEKVVLNLVFNAFKATPPAGTIRCSLVVDEPGAAVRIIVVDSGPGVPDERKATLFDRRAASIGDAGMGLHLSRAFARLHGGDIAVDDAPLSTDSRPGGVPPTNPGVKAGARFVVSLRIDNKSVGAARTAPPSDAPQRLAALAEAELAVPTIDIDADDPTGPGAKPRVLVVEDEVDVARHLRRALERAFEIAVVHNGREALQQALAAPPDLILTDVLLPEMGGEALLSALKADGELTGIPVVVLTGQDDRSLRLRMLRAGAADFLTKPYQPEELVQRLQNQIGQKRARDILAGEVSARRTDLEGLARSVSEHRRQLEDAVAQLAIARDLAETASRVKSNFLRMMSHEVRTPIAALDIHLGALVTHAHEQLDADARTHVHGIGRASARLIEIVETVVEWARIDAGRFRARAAPFSLAELAHDVAKDFAAHADLKGLDLRVQVVGDAAGEPLAPLINDRAIVRLIGVNLVGNAVKYTPRGSVVVYVEQRGPLQVLRVEDTGPGIPRAHHQAVFEPFRQLDDVGHTHGTGSGLGLAIVKDLVEAIGGKIELDSDTGKGTRITVTLPMLDATTAEMAAVAAE